MRRTLTLLLTAWLLAGCEQAVPPPADPVDPDGSISTAISSEPDTIDPQRGSFASEIAQMLMVYEPLLTFDPKTLRPIPGAARELPTVSADGLTVTFTLRDGLLYSDGVAVTARDFVYGWTRLCDPNVAGEYAFAAYVIAGCEAWNNMDPKKASSAELATARDKMGLRATDDAHVVFTLTRPAPYFLAVAALWIGVPTRASDIAAGGDRWTEPATYIGNGPFKLVQWAHNERLVFERNDRYRAPAKLKRWTKLVIPEDAVVRAAFRNSELDVAAVATDPDAVTAPSNCTFYVGFNTKRPPFDDPAVRLAFARALDRDAFLRDVIPTAGRPAHSLIPPGVPGSDPDDRTQSFDPSAARALLATSRYRADGPPIRFTYNTRGGRLTPSVKWAIAQWNANLGVAVTEDPIAPGSGSQLVKKIEALPQLFWLGWCSDYPDPHDWLSTIFRSDSTVTRTGYASTEFDALVDRADVEPDPARRVDLYRQAQRVLTRDAPVAFLYSNEVRYLVSPRLRGYILSATDWQFGQLTITTMYVAKPGF